MKQVLDRAIGELPENYASLRKGEEFKLELQLKPIPKAASLAIQGAIPGSQVLLDQSAIGIVQDDGSFTASSVPPGDHASGREGGSGLILDLAARRFLAGLETAS